MWKKHLSKVLALCLIVFSCTGILSGISFAATEGTDFEVVTQNPVTVSDKNNYSFNMVSSVNIPTISNAKGVFVRIKASGMITPLNFVMTLWTTFNYENPATAYEIGNANNGKEKVFVSLDGTVSRLHMPINFDGYVFVPANYATNANLDTTKITRIALLLNGNNNPGVWTWAGVTTTFSNAGYYTISNATSDASYKDLVTSIQSSLAPEYQLANTAVKTYPINSTSYICPVANVTPTVSNPKGAFFKVKHTTTNDSINYASGLDYQISLNSDTNKYNIGNGSYVTQRILIDLQGNVVTTVKGRVPKNFEGYVFVPGNPITNANLTVANVNKLSFWTNNWSGAASWVDSTLKVTNAGLYSVASYLGTQQYIDMVRQIEAATVVNSNNAEVIGTKLAQKTISGQYLFDIKTGISAPTIQNPKGIFLKLKATGMTAALDYQLTLGNAYGTYEINAGSNRTYVATNGTITTNYLPVNFDGYVFIPYNASTNANLATTNLYKIALLTNNWAGTAAWSNVTLSVTNIGYYSVPVTDNTDNFTNLVSYIGQKAALKYDVVSDFESVDDSAGLTSGTSTKTSRYTGSYALSENASVAMKVDAADWSYNRLIQNVSDPTITNPKGVFFRLKTDAPLNTNFMVCLGNDPVSGDVYNIGGGTGSPNKIYVSLNGTVTFGGYLPAHFDGYVFVAADKAGNGNLVVDNIDNIGILFNKWDTGNAWVGSTALVDNIGYYSVISSDDGNSYLSIVDSVKEYHPNNTLKDFYLTSGTGIPSETSAGIIGKNVTLTPVFDPAGVTQSVGYSVVSGQAVLTPVENLQSCIVKVTGGSTVIVRATSGQNSSVFADYYFYVKALGDVNFDNKVTLSDIILIQNHLINKNPLTGNALDNAKVCGGSALSITDLLTLKDGVVNGVYNEVTYNPITYNADTDWLKNAKYGIMVHYIESLVNNVDNVYNLSQGKQTTWNQCVSEFDVNKFASDANKTGAGYVIFSVMQKSKFMIAPNSTYDSITGYAAGEACATRDLISDLYDALNPYGIKLMLYMPADGPYGDSTAATAFGIDLTANSEFTAKWNSVIHEYSTRYGSKIAGWWVDGASMSGYQDNNEAPLYRLKEALTAGNPDAIVSFNPGNATMNVRYYSAYDDFTAGERNEFLSQIPTSRFVNPEAAFGRKQWHIMTYLGSSWSATDLLYTPAVLANYVKQCTDNGGVITFGTAVKRDGSMSDIQVSALNEVGCNIK